MDICDLSRGEQATPWGSVGAHFKTVPVGEASESFAPVPQKRRQAATGGSGRLLTVCLRTDLTFTFHLPSSTSAQGLATWAHLSVFGL